MNGFWEEKRRPRPRLCGERSRTAQGHFQHQRPGRWGSQVRCQDRAGKGWIFWAPRQELKGKGIGEKNKAVAAVLDILTQHSPSGFEKLARNEQKARFAVEHGGNSCPQKDFVVRRRQFAGCQGVRFLAARNDATSNRLLGGDTGCCLALAAEEVSSPICRQRREDFQSGHGVARRCS